MSDVTKKVKKVKVQKEIDYAKMPQDVWDKVWEFEFIEPLNYIQAAIPMVQKALNDLEHQIKINTKAKDVL